MLKLEKDNCSGPFNQPIKWLNLKQGALVLISEVDELETSGWVIQTEFCKKRDSVKDILSG